MRLTYRKLDRLKNSNHKKRYSSNFQQKKIAKQCEERYKTVLYLKKLESKKTLNVSQYSEYGLANTFSNFFNTILFYCLGKS